MKDKDVHPPWRALEKATDQGAQGSAPEFVSVARSPLLRLQWLSRGLQIAPPQGGRYGPAPVFKEAAIYIA